MSYASLSIRIATRADAEAFCSLSNSLYSRKVDEAYFLWQFFRCPHSPFLMLASRQCEVIGAFGVHVISGETPRAMCLDIMIARHAQGQGLIAQLAQAACDEARMRGAGLVGVVGNEKAKNALSRRLGWRVWAPVGAWTARNAAAAAPPVTEISGTPPLTGLRRNSFYPRDLVTLDWRTSNPRYVYQWLRIGDTSAPLGYSAVKIFRDPQTGEGHGDILDVFPSEEALLSECISAVQTWFFARGVPHASIYPTGASWEDIAQLLGFAPFTTARYFCGVGDRPQNIGIGMFDVDIY